MPPKVRELISQLKAAGFKDRGGKGSHRNFRHALGVQITLSGNASDDAKPYQVRETNRAIELIRNEKK